MFGPNAAYLWLNNLFPTDGGFHVLYKGGRWRYHLTLFLLGDLEQPTSGQECGSWMLKVFSQSSLKCHQRMRCLFCTTWFLILPRPREHLENISAFFCTLGCALLQNSRVSSKVSQNLACVNNISFFDPRSLRKLSVSIFLRRQRTITTSRKVPDRYFAFFYFALSRICCGD